MLAGPNGMFAWAVFGLTGVLKAKVDAEKEKGNPAEAWETIYNSFDRILERMRSFAERIWLRGQADVPYVCSVSTPETNSEDSAQYACSNEVEIDPRDGELLVLFIELLATPQISAETFDSIWLEKRQFVSLNKRRLYDLDVQSGRTFAAHEMSKLLFLPYLGLERTRQVMYTAEVARAPHQTAARCKDSSLVCMTVWPSRSPRVC